MRKQTLFQGSYLWPLLFLVLTALAVLFPLSGDDWQWGVQDGLSAINGRYMGNLTASLLTQNAWLRPAFMGLCISFLVWGVFRLTEGGMPPLLVIFLLLALNSGMFAQVYQWASGFSNFTVPAALLVLNLLLLQKLPRMGGAARRAACVFGLAVSLATQLFAEHVTLCALGLSLAFVAYRRLRDHTWDAFALFCLIGYAAGAALMFLNPAYTAAGTADAHSMPRLSELLANARGNFPEISKNLVMENLWLNLLVSALLLRLIRTERKGLCKTDTLLTVFFLFFMAYQLLRTAMPGIQIFATVSTIEKYMALADLLAAFLTVGLWMPAGPAKTKLGFAALALVLLNGPLLFVVPIGPRCFFPSYVTLAFGAGVLWRYLEAQGRLALPAFHRTWPFAALLISLLVLYFGIYVRAWSVTRSRDAAIAAALSTGTETIQIRPYPETSYIWGGNPDTPYLDTIFKDYYGIPRSWTLEITNG